MLALPRASLDLATAIQLSGTTTHHQGRHRRRRLTGTSIRSTISPAANRPGRRPGSRSHLAKEQAATAHVGDDDAKEEVGMVPLLQEKKGDRVLWVNCDSRNSRIEEEKHDQLVEDEEYELGDEMEAVEVA